MTNYMKAGAIAGVLVLLALSLGLLFRLSYVAKISYGDSGFPNTFAQTSTSSKETVGGSNVVVLATSTSRLWGIVSNDSTDGTSVFCTFNGAPATSQGGIVVAATSTLKIDQFGLYTGAVNCITQGGSAKLWVEAVQ